MFSSSRNVAALAFTHPQWVGAFTNSPCIPAPVRLGPLVVLPGVRSYLMYAAVVSGQAFSVSLLGLHVVRNSYGLWSAHNRAQSAVEALLAA